MNVQFGEAASQRRHFAPMSAMGRTCRMAGAFAYELEAFADAIRDGVSGFLFKWKFEIQNVVPCEVRRLN